MAPHESERLAGVPQLSLFRVHGFHTPKPASAERTSALSRHGREDVYRLSQGHCTRIAKHDAGNARSAVARSAFKLRGLSMNRNTFIPSEFSTERSGDALLSVDKLAFDRAGKRLFSDV